jgi:hypothetical protein
VSSTRHQIINNIAFVDRLIEACGTSEPAELQRLLNISYQAAKNYLTGRYPSTSVLIIIAERTDCSIHWLLTGNGKKFVQLDSKEDAPLPADHADAFVRKICVEVLNERFGSQEPPKVVVLPSDRLREEKATEEATLPKRS